MLKFKLTEFKQLIFAYSSLNFQRIPFIRTKFLRCMYFATWMHMIMKYAILCFHPFDLIHENS